MATYWRTRKGDSNHDYRLVNDEMQCWEVPCTTAEMFGEQWATCTFCGNKSTAAYWRGVEHDVAVCRSCAVEVLPKLMADALVGELGDNPNILGSVRGRLETALKNFWQAASGAIHRGVRCLRRTETREEIRGGS